MQSRPSDLLKNIEHSFLFNKFHVASCFWVLYFHTNVLYVFMLFKFLSSCRPAAEAVSIISNSGVVFLKVNIPKCSLSCRDAKGGKRIKTNTLCISRGSRISFPFQSDDGFFFCLHAHLLLGHIC